MRCLQVVLASLAAFAAADENVTACCETNPGSSCCITGLRSALNLTLDCTDTDLHIARFWACLGPWAESSGATKIILTDATAPDIMGMPKDPSHMHDAEFCYELIGESEYCRCQEPLQAAAQCGDKRAAATLASYEPWCAMHHHCPAFAADLLRTSMLCTAEGLSTANESAVICEYVQEDRTESKDLVQGFFAELKAAGMEDLVDQMKHPPSPPGTAHAQCAHAVKDLFNATLSAPDLQKWSLNKASNYVGTSSLDGVFSGLMHQLHLDTYDRLEDCMMESKVKEEELSLPMPLGTLFGNGSIISFESLMRHVCSEEVTKGWLGRAAERATGLRFVEDQWQHGDTVGKVEAGALVVAYLVIVFVTLTGIYCCVKQTRCCGACAETQPVMHAYGGNDQEEDNDQEEMPQHQAASARKDVDSGDIEMTEIGVGSQEGRSSLGNVA